MRVRRRLVLNFSVLALGASTAQSAAEAKLIWSEVPTPAPVTALAVGPNDIPFIATPITVPIRSSVVWYLGYGKGACSAGSIRICEDKWIPVVGVSAEQLFVTMDGQPWALDPSGQVKAASQPLNANRATDIWVPGATWNLEYSWGSGCARAFAISGYISTGPEAFRTPAPALAPWNESVWATGCDAGDDSSLWVLPLSYNPIGGVQTPGWGQLATRQGATSQSIAIFTRNLPVGPVQDVWFQDSLASGGGTWIYDQAHDKVVNVPNPSVRNSSKPVPPVAKGSAITDHYARFRGATRDVGWVYRWDDDSETWGYVIGDTDGGPIDLLAHSEAYDSSVGRIGPSRVWATDTSGRLYVMGNEQIVR